MKPWKRFFKGFAFVVISAAMFFSVVIFLYHKSSQDSIQNAAAAPTQSLGNKNDGLTDGSNNYSLNQSSRIPMTDSSSVQLKQDVNVEALVDTVLPFMVSINAEVTSTNLWGQTTNGLSPGSGILMDTDDTYLYLITNNHVVDGASSIQAVFIDDTVADCELKGRDSVADLAVLTIPLASLPDSTKNAITLAKLADSSSVSAGDMVIAVGNALGYGTSITVGYISATDREVTTDTSVMTLIQTDAAINPGNSGGALINLQGEVIGINSSKYSTKDVEGMGFAIPINTALPILNELKSLEHVADNEKGYLGIYITTITSDLSDAYDMPVGVYVKSIMEDSAAANSDLQPGDIITGINGIQIATSNQLLERVNSYRYGTLVHLTVKRLVSGEYQEMTVDLTLMSAEGLG